MKSQKQKQPKVETVIVNYESYSETVDCLKSLNKIPYENITVTVVNNGFNQSSLDLADTFSNISFINNKENIGFAKASNQVIRRALNRNADYIWLLNNDTTISDATVLEDLLELMESNTDIGIISPLITEYEDPSKIWFANGLVHWNGDLNDHNYYGESRKKLDQLPNLIENQYVPFCSAIIRAEVFDEIGVLPEDYFLYFEDLDFCIQAREAGFKIITSLTNEIRHRADTTSGRSDLKLYYFSRNRLLLMKKYDEHLEKPHYIAQLLWLRSQIQHHITTNNITGLKALIRGTIDGIRSIKQKGPYP